MKHLDCKVTGGEESFGLYLPRKPLVSVLSKVEGASKPEILLGAN